MESDFCLSNCFQFQIRFHDTRTKICALFWELQKTNRVPSLPEGYAIDCAYLANSAHLCLLGEWLN